MKRVYLFVSAWLVGASLLLAWHSAQAHDVAPTISHYCFLVGSSPDCVTAGRMSASAATVGQNYCNATVPGQTVALDPNWSTVTVGGVVMPKRIFDCTPAYTASGSMAAYATCPDDQHVMTIPSTGPMCTHSGTTCAANAGKVFQWRNAIVVGNILSLDEGAMRAFEKGFMGRSVCENGCSARVTKAGCTYTAGEVSGGFTTAYQACEGAAMYLSTGATCSEGPTSEDFVLRTTTPVSTTGTFGTDKGVSGGGAGASGGTTSDSINLGRIATNTSRILDQLRAPTCGVAGKPACAVDAICGGPNMPPCAAAGGSTCGGPDQPACAVEVAAGDSVAQRGVFDAGTTSLLSGAGKAWDDQAAKLTAVNAPQFNSTGAGAIPSGYWNISFGPFLPLSGPAYCATDFAGIPMLGMTIPFNVDWCSHVEYFKGFLSWVMYILTAFMLWAMVYVKRGT